MGDDGGKKGKELKNMYEWSTDIDGSWKLTVEAGSATGRRGQRGKIGTTVIE